MSRLRWPIVQALAVGLAAVWLSAAHAQRGVCQWGMNAQMSMQTYRVPTLQPSVARIGAPMRLPQPMPMVTPQVGRIQPLPGSSMQVGRTTTPLRIQPAVPALNLQTGSQGRRTSTATRLDTIRVTGGVGTSTLHIN